MLQVAGFHKPITCPSGGYPESTEGLGDRENPVASIHPGGAGTLSHLALFFLELQLVTKITPELQTITRLPLINYLSCIMR